VTLNQYRSVAHRVPFRPFVLVMADGREYPVSHPDFVAISPSGREIIHYGPDDELHLLDARLIVEIRTGADQAPSDT
jgi:hypothetical protein